MAQYKVPQDVEADDKLLGPFSFRQFVYLLIAAGCIAVGAALFQIFPVLVIIPALPALFFIILALPLKKDQPMETYLAAIVSYYLKPHNRVWTPGQRESTIAITAPKVVDDNRKRDITGEEATHRLSFLANIVDTEGQAIKGMGGNNLVNEELVAEANATSDMFETTHFDNLESTIVEDETKRHEEVIREMREAIARSEDISGAAIQKRSDKDEKKENEKKVDGSGDTKKAEEKEEKEVRNEGKVADTTMTFSNRGPNFGSAVVIMPEVPEEKRPVEKSHKRKEKSAEKVEKASVNHSIMELANNTDFSVATIAKEANRINRKEEGEVFISLH